MPTPNDIVAGLALLANDWRTLAIVWHVYLAAVPLVLVRGWRPPVRLLGLAVVPPLASVALLAAISGNPFNGILVTIVAAALVHAAFRFPNTSVRLDSPPWVIAGAASIAFGWTYPHFLTGASWVTYLYAAPFGVLPCPTLSVAIGVTLAFRNLRSGSWSAALASAGILYGAVGLFGLGVRIDGVLLLFALVLAVRVLQDSGAWRSVRADRREHARRLPGDELIPTAVGSLTHAVTIAARADAVWPWLVQMGAAPRAGWYSYDLLDNGRRPSAVRLMPELQHVSVGDIFPALPGVTDGFKVLAFEPVRSLVLGWTDAEGKPVTTWAFFLEKCGPDSTRLIVRARGGPGYRLLGLPPSLSGLIIRIVHFIMQRKQLHGIARRVEANGLAQPARPLELMRRGA